MTVSLRSRRLHQQHTHETAKMGLDWESLHEKFLRLDHGHGIGYGKRSTKKTLPASTNRL
ncbi:MAG: hypothetical protein ACLT98_16435 [Eggerthellaceae bacterium]